MRNDKAMKRTIETNDNNNDDNRDKDKKRTKAKDRKRTRKIMVHKGREYNGLPTLEHSVLGVRMSPIL